MNFVYPNLRIANVLDGDTLVVDVDLGFGIWRSSLTVRLNGIDAPEVHSRDKVEKEAGLAVKEVVKKVLAGNRVVGLESHELDKYGRILGDVILENAEGRFNLAQVLLARGLVRKYGGEAKQKWERTVLASILGKAKE